MKCNNRSLQDMIHEAQVSHLKHNFQWFYLIGWCSVGIPEVLYMQELPPANEVHLSPQIARSDISSTSPDEYAVMSIFSHAVLNDTGWYRCVGEPQPLLWGIGRDREFIEEPPKRNNTAASVRHLLLLLLLFSVLIHLQPPSRRSSSNTNINCSAPLCYLVEFNVPDESLL